jgi:hypothetical protein
MLKTLIAENAAIQTSFSTELLQKQYNDLLFRTYARGNTNLTEAQIAGYTYLASQCPLINGDVVYRSRAVAQAYNDTLSYNDYIICQEAGYELKSTRQSRKPEIKAIECSLSPNPATDRVRIHLSRIPSDLVSIVITNTQGQIVYQSSEMLNSNLISISTKDWSEGFYIVSIQAGKSAIFDGKLVISHK